MESEEKAIKIARKIVGFVPQVTIDGIEVSIDEIEIVFDYKNSDSLKGKIASKSILAGAKYKLSEIKNILQCKVRTTLKTVGRIDKKDDWTEIGLDLEQAKNVLKSLTEEDYICTHYEKQPFVDEYHKKYSLPEGIDEKYKKIQGDSTYLYIKLYVENHKIVFSMSFHWGETK